jgi:acyl-CoA synthetase (AMP-forming)/AMP-acid ligase II
MLESLDPSIMPKEGDRLPEALGLAQQRIEKSKAAGSILVIADQVDSSNLTKLAEWRNRSSIPVQFLVPIPMDHSMEGTGILEATAALGATAVQLSPSSNDIELIARRSERNVIAMMDSSTRWRDEGYWLVVLVAIVVCFWSRRGWSVKLD